MQPLITTIIPTFCRPDRLKRAIESVLSQTYPHLQVWIYDNASGDSTEDVVESFAKVDPRVRYHCHASDIGAAENFQFGLSRVDTPFFSFLADDDLLLPNFYETALDSLKKYPEAAFFYGAVVDVNERREIVDVILSRWPDKAYFSPPDGLLEMIGKYSNWTGVLFRKELVQKIGPLDLHIKAIDVDYMFRIAERYSFVISKNPCAIFVQHPSSYSSANGLKLIWPGWNVLMDKIKESSYLTQESKNIALLKLQSDLQKLLFMNALRGIERKDFDESRKIAELLALNSDRKSVKRILATTIWICKTVPVTHELFAFLLKLRRYWQRRIKNATMQTKYGQCVIS